MKNLNKVFYFPLLFLIFTILSSNLFAIDVNIATSGTATQNTTGWGGTPEQGIDTDTNTFQHTLGDTNYDWWYLDLGSVQEISTLKLYKRSGQEVRSKNMYFMISDTPFTPQSDAAGLTTARALADWEQKVNDIAGATFTLNASNTLGRYILIQKDNETTNNEKYINFSELEVWSPIPSYTCPTAGTVANIDGATDDVNATYREDSTGANKARYFKFTPAVGGEMTISYDDTDANKQTFLIGTSCDDDSVYKQTSGLTSDSKTFYVVGGNTYHVRIQEKNGADALKFTANFQFKALYIGFEHNPYSFYEDVNLPDNIASGEKLIVKLSHPVPFDIEVTFNTEEASPQSAIINEDFKDVVVPITILAGDTNATVYVDIIHDIPIEFDENFFVRLSNIVVDSAYSGVVELRDHNPTEIIILEQITMPVCYQDDFSSSLDAKWRTLFSNGAFEPAVVDGRLRLTPGKNNIATAVTKDYEFYSKGNIIIVEFEQFAWGGCDAEAGGTGSGGGTYGGDGIVAVLYDSAVGASPAPGAYGGSMGYAQGSTVYTACQPNGCPGFEGGWLGLGIDEYGNFANGTEGRVGGIGFSTNYASIRGDGNGSIGYEFLKASSQLNPAVALQNTSTASYGHKYRFTADARDDAHLYITLERDINDGNGYQTIINRFDGKDPQYNQTTTPDFVRFAFTSGSGGACNNHEIDELKVSGRCRAYSPTSTVASTGFVDAVDIYTNATYTDTNGPDIKTKVANKGAYDIDAVYLGSNGVGVNTYAPTGTFDALPLSVEMSVSDSSCTDDIPLVADDGSPFGWAEILVGNSSGTTISPVTFPALAMPDARLKLKALDWNSLFESYNVSNSCKVSSTHGSLCGVPSCLGSAQQANEAFPPDGNASSTSTRILTTCYGLAADGSGSISSSSACNGTNYNGSCGGVKTPGVIQPSDYDNKVGCLSCILNILAEATCSVDHFAIRPDRFELSATSNTDMPDLLRSGSDYNITINAYDFDSTGHIDVNTTDYNQTKANMEVIDSQVLAADGSATVLNGTVGWSTTNFVMENGRSVSGGVIGDVAGVIFDDVGRVNLQVKDKNWANIDGDDTSQDCTADGAYICGEGNVTYIPHHFSFKDINITNNNGWPGTFTYISDLDDSNVTTFDMAARIQVTIVAENESNGTTQNFQTGAAFYENSISVNSLASHISHGDANTTSIPTALLGGFVNGEKTVAWNENNTSQVLRFNFPRDVNATMNPFVVRASDVNLSTLSIYTGTAPSSPANIAGSENGLGDGNTTMVYGRTHAGRQRYEVPNAPYTANIYYQAYCFGTDASGVACQTGLLTPNIAPNLRRTDDTRWYINEGHTTPASGIVGNVTERKNPVNVTANPLNVANGNNPDPTDLTYNHSSGTDSYPYKTTMENNASRWLIYNEDDPTATRNNFPVEFNRAQSGWSGEHETNTTTNDPATSTINRRTMW